MLSKMVIKLLKGNKKVPAGCYVLNIPLIIIKRKNYLPQIHVHLELAQTSGYIVYYNSYLQFTTSF